MEYDQLLVEHGLKRLSMSTDELDSIRKTIQTETRKADGLDGSAVDDQQTFDLVLQSLTPGMGLQNVIDNLSEEIESVLGQISLSLPTAVLAVEFPTGSFNAMAYACDSGALLLVNTGLMMFVYKTCKLLSHLLRITHVDSDGEPRAETVHDDSALTHDQIADRMASLVMAYLKGIPFSAERLPSMSRSKRSVIGPLVEATEKFVLAHEYGHAIAGHLRDGVLAKIKTPCGEMQFVKKSWKQEIEADALACQIVLATQKRVIDDMSKLSHLQLQLAGPIFFFALDGLMTKVETALTGVETPPMVRTHPPWNVRLSHVRNLLIESASDRAIGLGDAFAELVSRIGGAVASTVKNRWRG